jgi:hypothetical protein
LLVANPNVIEKALTRFYLNFAYLADLVYVPRHSKSKDLTVLGIPAQMMKEAQLRQEPAAA